MLFTIAIEGRRLSSEEIDGALSTMQEQRDTNESLSRRRTVRLVR